MVYIILQNLIIAFFICLIGIVASRLLGKLSKHFSIKIFRQLLDEITSDCKRGIIALGVVYFFATTAVLLTPLRPDFIFKNIGTGLVFIICSILISLGTLIKENLSEYYGAKDNISPKDKSITLTLIPIISSVLRYLYISCCLLLILAMWGINITPVLSGTAIALAVFGFAGQSILQDLIGFSSLIIDRPYYVGSDIEFVFDEREERGIVKEITLRNTILEVSCEETENKYQFFIPNRDVKNFRVWRR